MALDQSALLEVLDALKAADVDDRIRSAATTIYQALIEAASTATKHSLRTQYSRSQPSSTAATNAAHPM